MDKGEGDLTSSNRGHLESLLSQPLVIMQEPCLAHPGRDTWSSLANQHAPPVTQGLAQRWARDPEEPIKTFPETHSYVAILFPN